MDAHRVRTVPRLFQEPTRVDQDADERVAVFPAGSAVRHGDDQQRLLELVVARRPEQERLEDFLVERLFQSFTIIRRSANTPTRHQMLASERLLSEEGRGLTVPSGVSPLNLIWLMSEVASCSVLIPLPCARTRCGQYAVPRIEKFLDKRDGAVLAGLTSTRLFMKRTWMPSSSKALHACATRETINLASSMRVPPSSKAARNNNNRCDQNGESLFRAAPAKRAGGGDLNGRGKRKLTHTARVVEVDHTIEQRQLGQVDRNFERQPPLRREVLDLATLDDAVRDRLELTRVREEGLDALCVCVCVGVCTWRGVATEWRRDTTKESASAP